MLTRKAVTRVCERQGKYSFKSCDSFPKNVLPTKRDVLQRLLHERTWRTRPTAFVVANELSKRWIHCNVYCITVDGIVSRIQTLVKDFRKIESQPKKGKKGAATSAAFENNIKKFLEDIDGLFDTFCIDQQQRRRQEEFYELRMNSDDFAFYEDQKGPRKAKCLSIVKQLDQSDINFKQKVATKHRSSDDVLPSTSTRSSNEDVIIFETDISLSEDSDTSTSVASEFIYSNPAANVVSQQNRVSLKEVAMTCERYDVSDRAGAAIASATLKAFGIISEADKTNVVDRSKLRRERQKYREELRQNEAELFDIVESIFIDGRKDATLTMAEVDGRYYRQTCIEEHYVIVGEPSGFYLSHVTPDNGSGIKIAEAIFAVMKDTPLEKKLKIIGSDSTAVMTGKNSGCIASLEALLGRPLQWAICLLHLNELPLRHVFSALDGTTTGPNSFSGPIGKHLNGAVSDWKVVKYKPIPNPKFPFLPNPVVEDLSSDQYYAYRICSAVMLGTIDTGLELLEVGGLSHSRWLTLGCRILRFYVSQEKPTSDLCTLAEFLIKVYFPSWFEIKTQNKITDGPINFFHIVQRVMKFSNKNVREIATMVLHRNAYFAHHENLLLAMLGDDDQNIRLLAINKILSIREKVSNIAIA